MNPTNMEEKMQKGTLTLTWFFMAKPGREAVAAGTTMLKMLKAYTDPMAEWSPTAEVERTEVDDIADIITEDVDVASPVYFEGDEAMSIDEAYAEQFGRTIADDFGK